MSGLRYGRPRCAGTRLVIDRSVPIKPGETKVNSAISEEDVRRRAHELWEQWGRPEVAGDKFWLLAEQELVHGKPSNGERNIVSECS
jgi:hypothetical protein